MYNRRYFIMGRIQTGRSHQDWYAVLCLFVSYLSWVWLIKGLGVMLPTLQEQFATQTWRVGWMLSIITAVICFTGTALSVVPILIRALLGRRFTTNYGTAVGIGTAGGAVGMITVGPFTQLLLDTYGWRGALLILGGLFMHLGVCGALLRSASSDETNDSYQLVSTDANEEPQVGLSSAEETGNLKKSSRLSAFKDALSAQMKHFGFSVCFKFSFWITAVIFICRRFVVDQWMIYFISQAGVKDFSPYDAVTFTTAGGVGNVVTKILLGVIVDKGLLKLRPVIALMITLSSSAILITPWINSYWLMMVTTVVYFSSQGTLALLNDLYTRELLGPDLLTCAFAWMDLASAILSFSLGFFPGWMYDQTGSFDWAFFIIGCISALSLTALLMEWVQARCKPKQTA
ncbi:monocarboxylate transporter 12-like isoform X2 [Patiria miniata]|uniref:Major facilitator superfamily (MFS) profile domain-containing protein n=1 Tax=Patiria miniata TaxID=46514 RepID=A0A914B8W3_PATMI|nr:monocarboxylate transporter 12-like isoform X2 [Patiria miniata]